MSEFTQQREEALKKQIAEMEKTSYDALSFSRAAVSNLHTQDKALKEGNHIQPHTTTYNNVAY